MQLITLPVIIAVVLNLPTLRDILCKKTFFLFFLHFSVKWKLEIYHHGEFQQQSPQHLVNRYQYRGNQSDG